MLISAHELSRMDPLKVPKDVTLIFMGFGTYSDLYEVLDYPMSADENYVAWLDHERELNALRDACRHKYEAIKSGIDHGVECWQRVIDVLREMIKRRKALGLEAVYWDVG